MPFGSNHRYDFVLDLAERFVRVQCKTGRIRDGVVQFNAQSTRCNRKGAYTRGYAGEIELFAVYCPENERVYAVPIEEATSTVGTLRLSRPVNGQARRIRWAVDYELPA